MQKKMQKKKPPEKSRGLNSINFKSRRSNVEVHRTCQFAVTVLTPATTGNGGSTYRFDILNIHSLFAFWQGGKTDFISFWSKSKIRSIFRSNFGI
ncbi:MAG TPA: hypothetical protein VF556_12270 [Pyrinomonadaceae bacterium]|jgi:hypothetical protein